jgi:hypothetical protein
LLNGNIVGEVASCPTPTPTPTSTSTPTPTPTATESPLDFSIASSCDGGGSVSVHHYTGGSGQYDRGNVLYDTESEALNETQWSTILNPNGYVGYGVLIPDITKTYWVAARDRNNLSNIIAKSILVDCAPTPTPTPTPTETPTPTMYYYNVNGYSCGTPCNYVGQFNVSSPTPLTIGYFYNNPENRGYTFEILASISTVSGSYDLTGEPGFTVCTDACTP